MVRDFDVTINDWQSWPMYFCNTTTSMKRVKEEANDATIASITRQIYRYVKNEQQLFSGSYIN